MSRYTDDDHCSTCGEPLPIAVTDRLPPVCEPVLFWVERTPLSPRGPAFVSSWELGTCDRARDGLPPCWSTFSVDGEVGRYVLPGEEKVTHWRELPPPPEK